MYLDTWTVAGLVLVSVVTGVLVGTAAVMHLAFRLYRLSQEGKADRPQD